MQGWIHHIYRLKKEKPSDKVKNEETMIKIQHQFLTTEQNRRKSSTN